MKRLSVLIILLVFFYSCKEADKGRTIQGVTETEELSITGKIPGRIEQIFIAEGDVVRKGDTLALLYIPEVEAKKAQALAALESANAQYNMSVRGATKDQLKQLNSKKEALTEQYEFAKKSVDRLSNMLQDSLVPQQQYDEAYAKFQGAKAQLNAVNAEISGVKNGVRIEEQNMALGQKNRALGALQEVNAAEIERYVIAPADMTIDDITLKEGELAMPGYTLFKGPLPQSTYFRFTLPENRLNEVKKGDKVKLRVVYEDREIDAVISQIKQLAAYADISTAYPDYELSQSLFELKIKPENPEDAEEIIPRTTVTLNL